MDLIKVFISKISDRGSEASTDTSESRGRGGSGEENETTNNMEDRKSVDRQETDTIIFDCNNFLAFLQSSALNLTRVEAATLSLRENKYAMDWFRLWSSRHIAVEEHRSLVGRIISRLDNVSFVGLIYSLLVFS